MISIGDVELDNCPKKQMLTDPFTKRLQGQNFREFHAEIMNVSEGVTEDYLDWDALAAKMNMTAASASL